MARKKVSPKQFAEMATGVRLSSHEKLCAERMNRLLKSIDTLSKDVNELKINVAKGKGAVSLLFALGAVIGAILGYFNWDG